MTTDAELAQVTAVVLAGGPPDAVSALQPGAPNKAFVEIAGTTLVERTIAGLRASNAIGRIIAVAPPSAHASAALRGADALRPDGVKVRDSMRNGLDGLPPDELTIVSASDLPILSGPAVDDFVARARAIGADLGYGCLEKLTHTASFPEVPHTWAHMRDGTFCGGGMIAIKPRVLPLLERFLEQLGAARKNPLQLAGLFGKRTLLKYALRMLTVAEAEARASAILGAPVRAIVSPYAETAVNVDRVTDVPLAENLVANRRARKTLI